jgi:curved DNA-binding protein CbpA
MTPDPFAALGLRPSRTLSDSEVRQAWRRNAAATHPDRPDGGNPQAYRDASAAYAVLRTPWGRSEAWADLQGRIIPPTAPVRETSPRVRPHPLSRPAALARQVVMLPARIRHGRRRRLALRLLAAAAAAFVVWLAHAGMPATAGVLAGVGTWLLVTGRSDLAPPGDRT